MHCSALTSGVMRDYQAGAGEPLELIERHAIGCRDIVRRRNAKKITGSCNSKEALFLFCG